LGQGNAREKDQAQKSCKQSHRLFPLEAEMDITSFVLGFIVAAALISGTLLAWNATNSTRLKRRFDRATLDVIRREHS
jgi:hypothetical protein